MNPKISDTLNVGKVKNFLRGAKMIEVMKISSKGQITLPASVRKTLGVKPGDQVAALQTKDGFLLNNAVYLAFREAEKGFEGFAGDAGFESEEEAYAYLKEVRKELAAERKAKE